MIRKIQYKTMIPMIIYYSGTVFGAVFTDMTLQMMWLGTGSNI